MDARVVLGRKGETSMLKIRWTDAAPQALYEISDAEELGAVWEGDELVTYDLPGFCDLFEYYSSDTYLPDND